MPYYRPRMALLLTVPTMGNRAARQSQEKTSDVFEFWVKPLKATLILNDHNHADELHVTCDWKDVGTDPRLLHNAHATFYLKDVGESGDFDAADADRRFSGLLTRPRRQGEDGEAMTVTLEFLDYTTLFLEQKPFGAGGVPHLSMRLDEAWRLICDHVGNIDSETGQFTSAVTALRDRLTLVGLKEFPVLSKAVSKRFAKLAKVPVKPRTDAWAVWQMCVGMLGLISYIRLDECIVTSSTHFYTSDDPPRLVWGKNIRRMSESRNPLASKGIGLASFDPVTGRSLEAIWPPLGDPRVAKKTIVPGGHGKKAASGHSGHASKPKAGPNPAVAREADEREWFQFAVVHEYQALLDAAKNVYDQRCHQELEGSIATAEMLVETFKQEGRTFDLITLGAGDNIRIEFDPDDRIGLSNITTEAGRVDYLKKRGYSTDVATLMARNMSDFPLLDPTFYVKRVQTTLDLEGSGSFEIEINYLNRILIGSAPVRT